MMLEGKYSEVKYKVSPDGVCITTCPNGANAAVGSIACWGCKHNHSAVLEAFKVKTIKCSGGNDLHKQFVEFLDDVSFVSDLHKNFLYQQYLDNRKRL